MWTEEKSGASGTEGRTSAAKGKNGGYGVNLDSTKLTAREPDPVENIAGGSIPASPSMRVYVDTENLQGWWESLVPGQRRSAAGEITGIPATSETSGTAVSGDAMKNADVFTGEYQSSS